jgi:hypothetical protein
MAEYNNKVTLQAMLTAVLSNANSEQNQMYPPSIFSAHFNAVTSYIISTIAENLESKSIYSDCIEPFIIVKKFSLKNGYLELPTNYRNYWEAGVSVKQDFSGNCNDDQSDLTEKEFKDGIKKSNCISRPLTLLNQSEWDDRTTSSYKYPTYNDPVCRIVGGRRLQVCPYDIPNVELRYIRNEKTATYGYVNQPDDTYIFDLATSVESEWTNAAFKYLYEGLNTLYGVYTRDKDFREWSIELKKIGLL